MGNQFVLTRYVFFVVSPQYEGHLEMIWTCLICGSFVIFRLDIELLLAQYIPRLGYLLLTSPWGLPYGLTEQFFRGVAMPLADTSVQFPCCCSSSVTG
jgi:hypothetical protein